MSSVLVSSQNETTYAGKCKDRCENNRGGGPHAFQLQCKLAYSSNEEINDCLNVCSTLCPDKYCPGGETILCEAYDNGLDEIEIDIEDFKKQRRQEYEDELTKTKSRHEAELIPLAVVFALVVFAAIILSVWAVLKKKKLAATERLAQQSQLPPESTTTVHPYPPPGIRRQSIKVDGRVDSEGRVFIDGRPNNNNLKN